MLIILAGLPGTGKTTIARVLAKRLGAMHLRIDTIEQQIRALNAPGFDIGPTGYMIAYAVAEDNLILGNTVVADSVNPLEITRAAWRSVAERSGTPAVEIEVVCSDKAEHRRRAETRVVDVPGLRRPTWEEITGRAYEDWGERPIVVDTASMSPDEIVDALVSRLGPGPRTEVQ